MKKLLLIDTFNLLHRAFHALPPTFKDANGEPTNAVYGVTSMLINVLDQVKPDYVVAALDTPKQTFRAEDFTQYKAHRQPDAEDFTSQIPKVMEILNSFGITKIALDGYEADDIIGTLSKRFANSETEVLIMSNDRDLWQLVNQHVMIMLPNTKGDVEFVGEKEIVARMGFQPIQMIDYKSLRGDPSDNIPGVYGIGEVTAKNLIEKYLTLENIYKHIEEVTPLSIKEKLLNSVEIAYTSKKLATIITDVPINLSLKECVYSVTSKPNVVEVLKKYNFKSLMRRLGYEQDSVKPKSKVPEDQLALF